MQFAGQMVGQSPHATHLGRPSSCFSITWVPRHRGLSAHFSSGYSIVLMVASRPWETVLTRCRKVSAIPFSVARRYDVSRSAGRSMTRTVIAISINPSGRCLRLGAGRPEALLAMEFGHHPGVLPLGAGSVG